MQARAIFIVEYIIDDADGKHGKPECGPYYTGGTVVKAYKLFFLSLMLIIICGTTATSVRNHTLNSQFILCRLA